MSRSRGISLRYRIRILARDGNRCAYCGRTSAEVALEVDHIVPRARGGSNEPENLITACRDCNAGKSAELIPLPAHTEIAPLPPRNRSRLSPGRAFDPRFDGFRPFSYECDDCGKRSITVHFLPGIPANRVLFNCGCLVLGGRSIPIVDLFSGPADPAEPRRRWTAIDQLLTEPGGRESLWLLRWRLEKEQAWRDGDYTRWNQLASVVA